MLLSEVFEGSLKWEVVTQRRDYFVTKFKVGNITYLMRCQSYNADNTDWEVEFLVGTGASHKEKYGITGTGNSVQVFNIVVNIMTRFIKDYNPLHMTFSAEEPSRKKLYLRMIATLLPTWEVMLSDNDVIEIRHPSLQGKI